MIKGKSKIFASLVLSAFMLVSCGQANNKSASNESATAKSAVNNVPDKQAKRAGQETKQQLISRVLLRAQQQYQELVNKTINNEPLLLPRGLHADGSVNLVGKTDWTSGFFPGSLWYLYQETKDKKWKEYAEKYTNELKSIEKLTTTHDLGFMVQNSFGNGYRLTNNTAYKNIVVDAATSLSTRYRPVAKAIQSWDTTSNMGWISKRGWDMPIIIDNMMNLNLLFKASEFTGDKRFYEIAVNHANTTMKNHFRADSSSFHVLDYSSKTGEVISKQTAQGYADPTSWARGQAWGLYGFTEAYRETQDPAYLDKANAIAKYIINSKKIPSNHIPYWDYDAPDIPNAPRDASAAAITASALLELQTFIADNDNTYSDYAESILRELASEKYLATSGENNNFILMHSVGNIHTYEENDKPLNYADYYFLEAITRWKQLK
ncbi:MAG: glycoside hydrolase family 88 protein [Kangiellaceae bacterium]|nr:glycoside hydrolase family 88 protein [Kangiellaceae bacterium]